MKKLNLLLLCFLITISCREESNFESTKNETSQTSFNKRQGESTSTTASLSIVDGEFVCGNPNGSEILLDPNIPLNTNYNVSFWDSSGYSNCLNNGRECVDLSHFIGLNLPAGTSTYLRPFQIYYGGAQDNNTSSYDQVETFTIGETNNDGGAFGGDPYILDENTNKILQSFTSKVKEIKRANKGRNRIKSYEIRTDALLCIPPYKYVRLKVRYVDVIRDPQTPTPGPTL